MRIKFPKFKLEPTVINGKKNEIVSSFKVLGLNISAAISNGANT